MDMLTSSDSSSFSLASRISMPTMCPFSSRPVDIVPFGPIVNKDKTVFWPPEHEIFMSLLGFKEAYDYSVNVRLSNDPELDIKCPTLPALAIMKLISWDEKYPNRSKDAEDLFFIMTNYDHAGNTNRLYDREPELLEASAFDITEAAIHLLGRDMASIADPDTLAKVLEILNKETGDQDRYRLVIDIVRGSMEYEDKFEQVLNYLEKLKQGLNDTIV